MKTGLKRLIETKRVVVSDGAMATELEKREVTTDNALWSAMALVTNQAAIQAVHKSYFDQGAQIATTNTYQSNVPAFEKIGMNEKQSIELIKRAVTLAKAAKSESAVQLVAGSVGPYGAYLADGSEYTGAYQLTNQEYQDFHRPRMQAMVEAGVDFFALETMPNFKECQALMTLIQHDFPQMEAWLSFSVNDEATQLWDGTSLNEAASWANDQPNIIAVGTNCTKMQNILPIIKKIAAQTTKPVVVYPNNGDLYDPISKTWKKVTGAPEFSDLVALWIEAGARIIGGCCRTTPHDIAETRQAVNDWLTQKNEAAQKN